MPVIEQNGGGGAMQVKEGLKLFYLHAANGNNGNGSIDNPFGTFDLLNAFLDANPTIVGATIIVLGGTFYVDKNIYRGSSFYFFPGTYISVNMADPNSAMLEDFGTYLGSDVDFFFTGDVTVNIINGMFSKLGYYYSNVAKNAGKNFRFDFSNLLATDSAYGYLFELYGRINNYVVDIKTVSSLRKTLFLGKKSEYTPSGDESDFNNSGVNFNLTIKDIFAQGLYEADASPYSFIGRITEIKIQRFALSASSFIYKGEISIGRKCTVFLEINKIESWITPFSNAGLTDLFQNISFYENDNAENIYFIFKNTSFIWNTAFAGAPARVQRVRIVPPIDDAYGLLNVYAENCKLPVFYAIQPFITKNQANQERVRKLGVFANSPDQYVTDFNTMNLSMYYSVINL